MINITDNMIKGNCYNTEVYRKGVQYFQRGMVRDVRVGRYHVEALVSGTYEYRVSIALTPKGGIEYTQCDCPAFENYPGYCKHIVAVLIHMENHKQKYNHMYEAKTSGDILGFFESKVTPVPREFVEIEMNLEIMRQGLFRGEISPAISMRIGQNRLYVVKSIKNFIESIESHGIIDFGKTFSFDPSIHCFKDSDLPIIDFIREMYEIDKAILESSSYGYGQGSIFKGKYLHLTASSLGRFLNLMENTPFRIVAPDTTYDGVKVVEEDIPIEFLLKKTKNDLLLDIKVPEGLIPLSNDGKYMFLDGNVYSISKSQRENFAPFYKAIVESGEKGVRFFEKDREKFASIVLPKIKSVGKLDIDESVEELFYQRGLEARVYLDRKGHRITASVTFVYGDYTIDPFSGFDKRSGENVIILRDIETEREVLHLIEQSDFKINKSEVYLEDDDRIYKFVTEMLPELQKICEVYYSEDFKNIKIYDSSYYKSGVRLNKKLDLLEFGFSIEGIDKSILPEVFASLKKKKKYFRLKDGSFLPLDTKELADMLDIMEYLDLDTKGLKEDVIILPKYKAMYLDERLKDFGSVHVNRNTAFKELVQNIREPRDMDFELPESLKNIMRPYQVTGFKWLKTLASYRLGGILADDMGLGKTLQAIAFIKSEREDVKLPSIVVCPTSLVYNWENEINKFAPDIKALVVSGSKGERQELFDSIPQMDVVITSYPLIRRDIESYRNICFGYCILDEAQHIKNPNSISAKSVKELSARGYFALTGTPIENNLTELWSIFDFIMPGFLLSHKKFVDKFEKPIASNDDKRALKELNSHVRPFILRRLKGDVLKELPPKIESIVAAELTEEQKKIYISYLNQIKGKIEDEVREKGFEKSHIQILAGLTRLRQICCHPSMFIENYEGGSGKMDLLMELIQELLDGGHRVLLFSQFTSALKHIREKLREGGISYFYLDGGVEAEKRGRMVNSFNRGAGSVFLISLKAGGTGLNLTGADTVIHFDPWWNPAAEDQATDRAYRIGQKSAVQVMKLITKGTIEEKIFLLQQKKKELIGSVLHPGETFISKMTKEDIMDLFKI